LIKTQNQKGNKRLARVKGNKEKKNCLDELKAANKIKIILQKPDSSRK
jgi:hypothetical protein